MKNLILISVILFQFLMLSCQGTKDMSCRDAHDFFKKSLLIVKNYGTVNCKDSTDGNIFFANEYLKLMTGIDYSYILIEALPRYKSLNDKEMDIRNWQNWYEVNKSQLTSEKSDSIMKIVWDKHKAW